MKIREIIARLQLEPARFLAVSFLGMILAGTILLSLPISSAQGRQTGLIDALFTATSATCVTGLIVVDTPTHFSTFGQVVILLLIQIGGLGIMTLSTSLVLIFGRRIGLREKMVMQDVLDQADVEGMKTLILYILKMTLIIELLGAVFLFARWFWDFRDIGKAAYLGVFHAISAFCNAGFSLFSNSLMNYRGDIAINLIITSLIILGGIGFIVVADIQHLKFWKRGSQAPQLTVHTKLVLLVTLSLLLLGTILFFLVEYNNAMNSSPLGGRFLSSYFQSVTARTAGFNTIDFRALTKATMFVVILLMFIGASPCSTGGGIKTSSFGILLLYARSVFRGREEVELFKRTIPRDIVRRAVSIVLFSSAFVALMTIPLLITEKGSFIEIFFEVISAFGTVGLSAGLTTKLTSIGKLIVALLIFVGRIGPLTVAFAVGRRREKIALGYPEGRVMVG